MWTRSILGRQRARGPAALISLVLAATLGLGGCTAAYVKDSQAPVLFVVTEVNDGDALKSDVRTGESTVADDIVSVLVANRPKNPNFATLPQTAMAIVVERYEVSYYRSDGRGTEGVDIPYRISGNLTTTVDASTNGTAPVTVRVVRAQAKLEPPLINLWGPTSGTLGGTALIVTMFAKITIHGHTVAGQAVEASGNLQINFADYADGAS